MNGCYYFLKADPFFTIEKNFSAGNFHIEISGIITSEVPPDIKNLENVIFIRSGETSETANIKIELPPKKENRFLRNFKNLFADSNSENQR